MRKSNKLALAIVVAALMGACGKTQVLDTWTDSAVKPAPMKRIVVVGLSGDDVTRHLFEDTFSKELKSRGNDAVAGHTTLPKGLEANPDSALAAVRRAGFDGILTARSLGVHTEETETMGAQYYIPDSGYMGWNGYYGDVSATTYTTREEKAMVETHLYQTSTGKLVWGARSSTTSSGKLTESMKDYARSVAADLGKSGFVN